MSSIRLLATVRPDGSPETGAPPVEIRVESLGDSRYKVTVGKDEHLVERRGGAAASWLMHGERVARVEIDGKLPEVIVSVAGQGMRVQLEDPRRKLATGGLGGAASGSGPLTLRAPMPGRVVKLLAKVGESLQPGQGVIVIEAMKMENELKAPRAGVLKEVKAVEGTAVEANAALVIID